MTDTTKLTPSGGLMICRSASECDLAGSENGLLEGGCPHCEDHQHWGNLETGGCCTGCELPGGVPGATCIPAPAAGQEADQSDTTYCWCGGHKLERLQGPFATADMAREDCLDTLEGESDNAEISINETEPILPEDWISADIDEMLERADEHLSSNYGGFDDPVFEISGKDREQAGQELNAFIRELAKKYVYAANMEFVEGKEIEKCTLGELRRKVGGSHG